MSTFWPIASLNSLRRLCRRCVKRTRLVNHPVIPSESQGSRCESFKIAPRDPSTPLRWLHLTVGIEAALWYTNHMLRFAKMNGAGKDRKSTRLNSSHRCISYAVFCLKKKTTQQTENSK